MSGFEMEPPKELEPWARQMLDQEQDQQPSQASEPAKQAEPAPAEAKAPETEVEGMLQRMEILQPGDFKAVASLIEMHPELRERIIGRAQEVCGNETVVKALELLDKPKAEPESQPAEAEKTVEPPPPEQAVDVAAGVAPAVQPKSDEFVYILSPLALEPTSVMDHVEFIKKNPQLRDKVMSGVAEVDPKLAAEVEAGLASNQQAPEAELPPVTPEAQPKLSAEEQAAQDFEYWTSFLNLDYDHADKLRDHVDFIRQNPLLRDKVLIGVTEMDRELAAEVRAALEKPAEPPAPAAEKEPTPPEVVEKAAAEAVPGAATAMTDPLTAPAPPEEIAAPEAGWVARARDFNDHHDGQVAQFIELTGGACLDTTGKIDPNLVAAWQTANGLDADGRIGDATIGAAINVAPTWAEADKMAQEEELPSPDPLDPAFAQ